MSPFSQPSLILASGSETRARLLRAAGVEFEIERPDVDEAALKTRRDDPVQVAAALADGKALAVSARCAALVIGADQTLDLDGLLMDKPTDMADARRQLSSLRGRTHRLHSAISAARDSVVVWRTLETAVLTVRDFSDTFLDRYLAREGSAILDCVGCYRLEGEGVQLFDRIEGDFFTVLGLPLSPLLAFLRAQEVLAS